MDPIFKSKRIGVYLSVMQEDRFIDYLKSLNSEVEVIIRNIKSRTPKSNQQNRYMWGVVYQLIADHTGYCCDDIHEICKQMFLKDFAIIETKDQKTKQFEIIRSTTSLTTSEMEQYLANIRQWASLELAVYIPLPNEVDYADN